MTQEEFEEMLLKVKWSRECDLCDGTGRGYFSDRHRGICDCPRCAGTGRKATELGRKILEFIDVRFQRIPADD